MPFQKMSDIHLLHESSPAVRERARGEEVSA
jgi:hypothetical protein